MSKFIENNLPVTYLNGVLLGINAIKDAYLWIDSPDCFFFKADHIQGNHDINSSLRKANGEHKFLATISDVDNVIGNRNNIFVKTLSEMASRDFTNLIFVCSMPMSQLVWVDYQGVIHAVQERYKKPIFNIPSRSMTGCWLDGYEDILFALAKNIEIRPLDPMRKKGNVAIVWNLFDRNEGDCRGNIEELKHICETLWLHVSSIWLDGGTYEDLLRINEVGTIISFPYGRRAAKMLTKRLNADIIEVDLPFGIQSTRLFIEKLWKHFLLSDNEIQKIIKHELFSRNDFWIMKRPAIEGLSYKSISYYGDPYLLGGIIDFCKLFGCQLDKVFIHGEQKHILNNLSFPDKHSFSLQYGFNEKNIASDIFISNRFLALDEIAEINKIVEFWFPSYRHHFFTNQPFLGIRWAINFSNRIFNTILSQK